MPKMVIMMVLKQPNATSKAKNPVKVGSKCNISSKNSVSDIRKKDTLTPYGQCPKKDILLVMTFLRTLSFVQRMRGWTTVH